MDGSGKDDCSACILGPTHLGCNGSTCGIVSGSGKDDCSACPATSGYDCNSSYSCIHVSTNASYPDQGTCTSFCVAPTPVTIVSFTPNPATSIIPPETVKLTWTTQGSVTSCSIDQGVGIGLPASGSVTVAPKVTTTYTLTCTGPVDSASKSITVTVGGPGQIECPPGGGGPPPCPQ